MKRSAIVALVAGLAAAGIAWEAHASACNKPQTVQIHFSRGASCWSYSGKAEVFTGSFHAGQQIHVTADGQEQDFENGRVVTRQAARDVTAELKGGGTVDLNNGQMVAPRSGTYTFTIFPCAVWGLPGRIMICA